MSKDKHALIKANIALNKQVQELERQNKRYREAIEIAMQNIKGVNNLGVDFALRVLGEALRDETSK